MPFKGDKYSCLAVPCNSCRCHLWKQRYYFQAGNRTTIEIASFYHNRFPRKECVRRFVIGEGARFHRPPVVLPLLRVIFVFLCPTEPTESALRLCVASRNKNPSQRPSCLPFSTVCALRSFFDWYAYPTTRQVRYCAPTMRLSQIPNICHLLYCLCFTCFSLKNLDQSYLCTVNMF